MYIPVLIFLYSFGSQKTFYVENMAFALVLNVNINLPCLALLLVKTIAKAAWLKRSRSHGRKELYCILLEKTNN